MDEAKNLEIQKENNLSFCICRIIFKRLYLLSLDNFQKTGENIFHFHSYNAISYNRILISTLQKMKGHTAWPLEFRIWNLEFMDLEFAERGSS